MSVSNRMLVLWSLHGLSLEVTKNLVCDRLSWMRFRDLVAAPCQSNTDSEKAAIQDGESAAQI